MPKKKLKWVTKPEGAAIYDDAFYVREQSWGTYVSVDSEGSLIVTSASEASCIKATRWFLKFQQDGGFTPIANVYTGTVEHKL